MTRRGSPTPRDARDDIPGLVETLLAAERRLEELTAGEVDTVASSDGRTFLLHRAQEQLRHGEAAKQAAILNALPNHVALLDGQGLILSVNESWRTFARVNGMVGAEYGVGLSYLDVCDRARGDGASEAHVVSAGIRTVLAGSAKSFATEYRCDSPTEQRWFLLTVTPLPGERPTGAVVMHSSITDRKASEHALEALSLKTTRRERLLKAALSSMSDLAQVYDRQGRILFANQALLDLWGLTLDAVVGKNFIELGYPDALAERLQRQLQEVLETKRSVTDETPYTSPTGVNGYYEYIFSPVFGADGNADFVVGSTRDVTERKHTEKVLRQSEERFRFLNDLGEAARAVADPEQIMAVMSRSLGEHLGASHCGYATVERDAGRFTAHHGYTDGCPSAAGTYQLLLFGPRAVATLDSGQPLVIRDVDAEMVPAEGADMFNALGLKAGIVCPLVKNQGLRAMMAVYQTTPRDWTSAEVAIVQDVADRCWATIERRIAEDQLRENETLRRIAGRTSRLGGWAADLADGSVTWSDEVCAIHDVPPGTMPTIEQGVDFYAPQWRDAVGQAFAACAKEGTPYDLELELITAKGRHVWARTIGEAQRDAAGAITRVQGALQDITERKAAAEALRTSMEEFRALAEAMPQMVWITRADGWNVYFNQRWMDYTGLTLEESLGHGWNKPFHPDDQQRAWDAWQHATATLGTYSLECRLRRADGPYRWWLIRGVPVQDAAGNIVKWFGTCTDIHDLKLAELAISASEGRFAKIFHSGVVAIGISEMSSGRLIDVNERWAEFFGYARDQVVGRTVLELELWADPADRERLIAGISAGRPTSQTETTFKRKSGEIRWALASMEAISLPGALEPLVIVVLVDMTERKQLESQLLHAQKMDAVGRLAGGVAHDFNNSLGVILGYTELLIPKASTAERGKLEQILKATNRAAGLTRQLLAFSRKQVVDPKVLDLNVRLVDLEKMLGRLIGEHIDLAIVLGEDLGQVKADLGQLEQVVMNLCVNARDAMPGGGMLRIETANAQFDAGQTVQHVQMTPGRYVMLAVSDNGCGIDKEVLPQIFEPFFTTKDEGKGTGLGLAMVYGIVKQAGGYVWAESEVGRGTTFKIYLPRIDDPPALEVEATPAPARGWETILLVEDEGALRAIARETLEEHGYRVLDAPGANEAIEIAQRHPEPIHLLLTDVVMPGMNGRALAESLVVMHPEMKVLYMSGYTADVIAHSGALEAGLLLIEKPFTVLLLLGRVREALGNGGTQAGDRQDGSLR